MNFKPLISEGNDKDGTFKNISLGRISFWMTFLPALYFWLWRDIDIHPSHLQMLYITATYNIMKKANWFTSTKSADGSITEMQQGDIKRRDNRPIVKQYGGEYNTYGDTYDTDRSDNPYDDDDERAPRI